jgi:hypothetical protein
LEGRAKGLPRGHSHRCGEDVVKSHQTMLGLVFLLLSIDSAATGPAEARPPTGEEMAEPTPGAPESEAPQSDTGRPGASRTACLVSLWNHRRDLDPTPLVEELGFSLIWSHDPAYSGQVSILQSPGESFLYGLLASS